MKNNDLIRILTNSLPYIRSFGECSLIKEIEEQIILLKNNTKIQS
jgi:hypothetical protein